jgi:transposase
MSPYSTTTAFVGLDIGKNIHVLGSYRAEDLSALHEPLTLYNDRAGFEQATRQIDELLARYGQVVIGNEPTGIYYEAWSRELLARYAGEIEAGRLDYRLVNPYLVKLARVKLLNGRARKSDALDTQAIAQCLQDGAGRPARLAVGSGLLFADWARRYRRLEHEQRTLGVEIIRQIDRLWPGALVNVKRFRAAHPDLEAPVPLVATRPLERRLVQALLDTNPNPYAVLNLGVDGVQALLRQQMGRGGLHTAQQVVAQARHALLPPPEVAALYAEGLRDDWQRYRALQAQLGALEAQADQLIPGSAAEVLVSVPGMSVYHAARYLGMVQDPSRFPDADHVWAFAGFDPLLAQSGDSRRVGQISKRGDPAFRDTLYLIGKHTARHCPPIRATFLQARQRFRDRTETRAVIHAARKANRLLFALLLTQQPYDPDRSR